MILVASMLQVIDEAAQGVMVLVDGVEETDFLRSRLTRAEVRRLLGLVAATLGDLPDAVREAMPEIDWAGWRTVARALAEADRGGDSSAWFAARALVPATLSWLRVYRRTQPFWFSVAPADGARH